MHFLKSSYCIKPPHVLSPRNRRHRTRLLSISTHRSIPQPSRLLRNIHTSIFAPSRIILSFIMVSPPHIPPIHKLHITSPQRMALHVIPAADVGGRCGARRRLPATGVELPHHGPDTLDGGDFGLCRACQVPPSAVLLCGGRWWRSRWSYRFLTQSLVW